MGKGKGERRKEKGEVALRAPGKGERETPDAVGEAGGEGEEAGGDHVQCEKDPFN